MVIAVDDKASSNDRLRWVRWPLCQKNFVATLPDDQLEKLVASAERISIETGDVLMHEGDDADYVYLVQNGTFEVSKIQMNNEKKVLGTILAGELVGELYAIYNTKRTATVIASMDGSLWRIDAEMFRNVVGAPSRKHRQTDDLGHNKHRQLDDSFYEEIFTMEEREAFRTIWFSFDLSGANFDKYAVQFSRYCYDHFTSPVYIDILRAMSRDDFAPRQQLKFLDQLAQTVINGDTLLYLVEARFYGQTFVWHRHVRGMYSHVSDSISLMSFLELTMGPSGILSNVHAMIVVLLAEEMGPVLSSARRDAVYSGWQRMYRILHASCRKAYKADPRFWMFDNIDRSMIETVWRPLGLNMTSGLASWVGEVRVNLVKFISNDSRYTPAERELLRRIFVDDRGTLMGQAIFLNGASGKVVRDYDDALSQRVRRFWKMHGMSEFIDKYGDNMALLLREYGPGQSLSTSFATVLCDIAGLKPLPAAIVREQMNERALVEGRLIGIAHNTFDKIYYLLQQELNASSLSVGAKL